VEDSSSSVLRSLFRLTFESLCRHQIVLTLPTLGKAPSAYRLAQRAIRQEAGQLRTICASWNDLPAHRLIQLGHGSQIGTDQS
jgi:hypothetical protein